MSETKDQTPAYIRGKSLTSPKKSESHIDVREILSIAWRRKWLLIIPVPVVAVLTLAGSYLITPEYESSTIIQIDPQIQLISGVQRLLAEPSNLGAVRNQDRGNQLRSIYNEIVSSNYASLLNERMQLVNQPDIERQAQAYVQMQPNMTLDQARLSALQDKLRERIDVGWASGDQIRISFSSTDARQARDIANNLGDIFIAERIRQDLLQIRSSQDFSDIQLEKYERQLDEKTREMTRAEQDLDAIRAREGTTTSATNRTEISTEIDQTDNEISDLRKTERETLQRLTGVSGLNVSQLTLEESQTRKDAVQELKDRLRQIGDLAGRYVWNDPQVISFRVRQNDLLNTIESENRRLVDQQYAGFSDPVRRDLIALFNARASLDYLYSKKPDLEAALDEISPSGSLIPEYEARLSQLQREVEVARDLRDRFRRQQESSTISQALLQERSTSKYRQVEPAKLALEPFKPNRKKIVLMGIMLGIALGVGAALLFELMDNSFKKVEDVEETLGLKVIGITPKVDFFKKAAR